MYSHETAWLTSHLFYLLFYYCLVSKPEEVMKIEPTTAPNVNTVNAIQDLPGFLQTIAKLLVVNMGLQRFPTTEEINIDNSQGIGLQKGYHKKQ